MSRRDLLVAIAAAAVSPALAQSPRRKSLRVGVLAGDTAITAGKRLQAFREGMQALGYVEGRNLTIEIRYADNNYEHLAGLAAELVGAKVDVIVTSGTPPTRAAKQATSVIPIVMAASGD